MKFSISLEGFYRVVVWSFYWRSDSLRIFFIASVVRVSFISSMRAEHGFLFGVSRLHYSSIFQWRVSIQKDYGKVWYRLGSPTLQKSGNFSPLTFSVNLFTIPFLDSRFHEGIRFATQFDNLLFTCAGENPNCCRVHPFLRRRAYISEPK